MVMGDWAQSSVINSFINFYKKGEEEKILIYL